MSSFFFNKLKLLKAPLRVVLVAPFAILVIATVGLTGYVSFYNSQRAVNDLVSQLQSEITSRIEQSLHGFLDAGSRVNRNTQVAISLGMLNTQALDPWIPYFEQQIQSAGSLHTLTLGNAQGEYVGVGRQDAGRLVLQRSGQATGFVYYTYDFNNRNKILSSVPQYDPRLRPWYTAAAQSGKDAWSEVFKHFSEPLLQIATNLPLFDGNGKLMGVVAAGINLAVISDFLETLKIGQTGQTFILERSGLLIATSTKENPFRMVNGVQERLHVGESKNELTKNTVRYLMTHFGSLDAVWTPQQLDFNSAGKRYYLKLTPFYDSAGIDWLIAVIVPESDFMGAIYDSNRNTILLTLIALLVAIGVGVFTAQWVVRPILRLNAAAKSLACGDWKQVEVTGREDELGEMTESFNAMAAELQRLFNSLQQSVDELKQTGGELAESRQKYKEIFLNAPAGMYQASFEGKFLRANPAVARILGYDSAEEIIATITDIKRQLYVHPEEREAFFDAIRVRGDVSGHEIQFFSKSGAKVWISVAARIIYDAEQRPLFMEGFFTDINARKQAEAALQEAHALLESKVEERTQALVAANLELKNIQSQVIQQEKMASIGQLAAGVAHEINNPMGFILSNLESMQKYSDRLSQYIAAQEDAIRQLAQAAGIDSQKFDTASLLDQLQTTKSTLKIDHILQDTVALLAETREGAERVKNIVKDLKGFARFEREIILADINRGIESTINIIWNEIKYKAKLTKDLGEIPLIKCNIGQLNQVFMNLILNAAQAIEAGGEIHVKTWADLEHVFVSIADNGCGIPAASLSRIFEPFFTTKEIGKGTGLGLSVSYDIVHKHGGDIAVTSEPGQGTTFILKIPIGQNAKETEEN